MRVGIVILPEFRWSIAASLWRRAEEMGFDHAWTYDHLSWPGLMDSPWYGTTPTLTAAAQATTRIRLGTFVTTPNYRHPLVLARDVMALDDISGGRFVCGIGAGGGYDETVTGRPTLTPRQSVDRLTEFTELLDRLLTTDHVEHTGEYFMSRDARTLPGCVQQPRVPFVMAANGPRSLRLALRFGAGWVTTGPQADTQDEWWRAIAALAGRADDLLAAHNRPGFQRQLSLDSSPQYSLSSKAVFQDMTGRAAELGFTDVITHWPRPAGPYQGSVDVLEDVAATVLPALPAFS
jgi:alkanesulfonate monooxygenase SsuD/methylene tetrahydromethanopterin reductase-like flavin-dependent oxidoreductase (luciferase family)